MPKATKTTKKEVKKIVKTKKKVIKKPVEKPKEVGPGKYYEAVGRRKESTARVRLYTRKITDEATGERAFITVNKKPYYEYFDNDLLIKKVEAPLTKLKSTKRFKVTVLVRGGGITGQADAIKHGLARALVVFDSNFSKKMKKSGFLTRDSRVKERKKYGLKKARKAPQWSKR